MARPRRRRAMVDRVPVSTRMKPDVLLDLEEFCDEHVVGRSLVIELAVAFYIDCVRENEIRSPGALPPRSTT